jgi:NAD(P)-dependent dehydrogenase (short-subunit alcohol dehydrogenase family)
MRAAGNGGSIVLATSSAGLQGYTNCSHYVAAAHAVARLTRTLALEVAADNIRVNALCPTARSASAEKPTAAELADTTNAFA